MTNNELNQLAKQLRQGNKSVFDDIYHETKDVVFYTILGILKDRSLSEDVMQDVYIQVLKKIKSFKPKYVFKSWVITIAKNMSYNVYNRRKKEVAFDATDDAYIFGSVANNSEKELMVKEMLESLDEDEREIVILKVIGDFTHKAIAKKKEMPLGTVTWKYNEALKKLKETYRK
ncbi:MAG: RNA polymerase sigma factor [Candidatus Izimaplasma sp.]|nr:RNA polymerase sigma factor [Candidatus Izimaplasma bacterium]